MISISWISSCFVQSALSHSIMEFHRWEPWCQSNSHFFIIVGNLFFFFNSLESFKYIFLMFWNFTKLYLFVGYFSLFIPWYQVNFLNLKICPLAESFLLLFVYFLPLFFLTDFYAFSIGWLLDHHDSVFPYFLTDFFPLLSGRYPQIYFIDLLMNLSTITFLISKKLSCSLTSTLS